MLTQAGDQHPMLNHMHREEEEEEELVPTVVMLVSARYQCQSLGEASTTTAPVQSLWGIEGSLF